MEKSNPFVKLTRENVAKHNSKESCWVIFEDKVFDLTSFVNKHPGGSKIIIENAGIDVTLAFNEIGHSEFARELLSEYCIGKLGDEIVRKLGSSETSDELSFFVKFKTRLFTKEDKFFIHKVCGAISLVGLLVASIYVIASPISAEPFFTKIGAFGYFLLFCHATLATSSLLFHVPNFRHIVKEKYMEHKEIRLHSIIFSFRSISFVLWYLFEPLTLLYLPYLTNYVWAIRASLLSLWHYQADLVTRHFKGWNSTTIRGSHSTALVERFGAVFASIAQIGAILILLGTTGRGDISQDGHVADLCYIVLLPIQFLVFQLTLKRKGFIGERASSVSYMVQLATVALAAAPGSRELFILATYGIMRFIFKINKFLLFFLFSAVAQFFLVEIPLFVVIPLMTILVLGMLRGNKIQAFLVPTKINCTLQEKNIINEGIYHLRFKMPGSYVYCLSPGKHLAFKFEENQFRFYTPIIFNKDDSTFEILAKTYPKGVAGPRFFESKVGDKFVVSGPHGNIFYNKENGSIGVRENFIKVQNKKLLCIAGGSGITPIYAILLHLDKRISSELVMVNRNEADILLEDRIINLSKNKNIIFHFYLTREERKENSPYKYGRYELKNEKFDIAFISGPKEFCKHYRNQVEIFSPKAEIVVF